MSEPIHPRIVPTGCRPDEDPEFCATHKDGMFARGERVCDEYQEPTEQEHDR